MRRSAPDAIALKHRPFWLAAGVAFVALVIHLSLTPRPLDVPSWEGFKVGHILAYAWLMFWYAPLYASTAERLFVGAFLLGLGIALEYVQGMVGRDFSYTDMRDDGIGVVLGWIVAATPLGKAIAFVEERLAP